MLIQKDEPSNASRRVPCRIFTSNGTSPDTGAVGDAVILWLPSGTTISCSSGLTAIHAAQGMYYQQLTQSEVSLLGLHALYHTVGDFPQHLATIEVVNSNPLSTQSNLSNVTVGAIVAGTYSSVTIQGLSNYANFPLTSVATSIWSATRSAFTTPGSFGEYVYSQVTGTSTGTVQGVTRVNSSVTIANALYSAVTVRLDTVAYSGATVGAGNIAPGAYSGVSVEITTGGIQAASLGAGTITAAKFAASAIDAAALATDAGQEIADRVLSRNIATGSDTGRTVAQAFAPLRNKVQIDGSTITVFDTDDSTSLWTGSITTGTNPLSGLDPL